jgi:hypothetical protein
MTLVENSLLTAAGEDALEQFQTLSTTEQAVHSGNTALGWHAMQLFKGLIEAGVKLAKEAVVSATSLEVTGIETKAAHVWNGGNSNTPVIVFRKLPEGVTSPKTNVAYFIINGTANKIELSTTFKGAAIKIEGKALTVAGTEIAILASAEDNTAIGSQAGGALTTGGGNTMVGENAGHNLTSGEENVAVGCESLAHQQTVTGNVAVGFMACWANTTGTPNCALGYQALEQNTTGSYNVAMGDHTLQAGVGQEYNTGIGHYSLNKATAGAEENTALGAFCMKSVTTGKQNLAVGAFTGDKLTTGGQNVFIGSEAGLVNVTGSGNIYIGVGAGKAATGSNELIIANNGTTPLIAGTLSGTQKLGFFGVTPVVKPAKATTVAEVITALESLGLMA